MPAGWGDIAIGLTAPLVALALVRRLPGAVPLAILWNVLGLLDLIVAVGMATGLLAPLLFGVPVAVLLHVLALGRLLRERRPRARLVPWPAR